jgi:hypothetical protein
MLVCDAFSVFRQTTDFKFEIPDSRFQIPKMAERVGFEPTERFPVHSISSAANSTTLAPLPGNIANFRLPIADLFRSHRPTLKMANRKSAMSWRRGWDSNPRWALTHSGFRDRCTNPLCDLSVIKFRVQASACSFVNGAN